MDEARLQELNAIRDRMLQGMSGYQAINYDALPKNQVSFEQYSNFINTQNDIEVTGKMWKSFANGGISVINGMMGTARMLMDRRMSYEAQEGEAAGMAGVGSVAVDELARPITKLERYNVQANSTVEQAIYGLAEGGAQLAAQALVTMMTGGIGGGVFMGAQIAGNQYADLREKGVDAERAFTASVTNALIQTPMEQIALGKIMKALPAGSGLRKKAMEMLESGITEGFTEGLQSLPEQLTNIWAENNGIDALGVAREWDKNASDNIKDMVFSGFIGAILGSGAKGLQIAKNAINTGFEKMSTKALTGTLESTAENIKKNKMENAQEKIDMLNQGQTVINLDAEQVMQYAYAQKANIEDVAKSLGTTKQDIEDAAAVGGDISVSFGHMASTMAQNESFGQAMKEHISFGDQGKSLNYFQLQKELEQTYGESSDRQQALKTELDAIEKSMVEAEIPADQIKKEIALANAFAISMSPDNPAAFLKKYQVRFEKGEDGTVNTLFQRAYNTDTVSPYGITQVNATNADKVNMIAQSMEENGYDGRPIVVMENADEYIGLTGSHRIDAAKKAGIDVEVVSVENNDDTVRLLDARDDYELSDIAKELYDDGKISKDAFELLTTEKNYAYEQKLEQGTPKGAFTPQADGTYVISMFKGRDASTVIHETGHYFFEVFMQESGLDSADERLRKDREAFLNYVGMTDEEWRASDIDGRRKAHERIATAFEQYLLEGKAPSRSLRGVFERFSAWLKKIYGEVVKSPDYEELTDEVRDAFDHWLAADADIEEAMRTSGMYTKLDGKITSMLNDKQRAWLEDKIAGAREKAVQMITKEYMSNFSSKRREEITRFRADIEKEVKDKVHALRVNQARANVADLFATERQVKDKEFTVEQRNGMYFAVSKDKTVTVLANPKVVARKYMYVLGNVYDNYAESLQNVQSSIDDALMPIIDNLKQGYGNGVETYWVNRETGEPKDVSGLKDELTTNFTYEKVRVSNNAPWYQKWFKEHQRRPTKEDLYQLARDIYSGKDDYGYYQDAFFGMSINDYEDLKIKFKQDKAYIDLLFNIRDGLLDNKDVKTLIQKSKKYALTSEERLGFDSLAEDLGYSSGSEMAQDILNAKSEAKMIQEEMKRRVDEKFPDYATERELAEQAKIKALYDQDEGGMVAALEQQLIEEAAEEAVKRQVTMQERMAKAKEAKAQAEVAARNQLLKMKMKDALNARRLAMQERRAAANAKRALKKGDLEAASEYKRQQMVLHAMVRHSLILKAEVAKAKKFAHKIAQMKKDDKHFGNEKNFDQMMFFLYRLGVLRYDTQNAERRKKQLEHYNPADHTLPLEKYVAEMEDRLGEGMLEISKTVQMENVNISNSADMTIAEYQEIHDSLYNLYGIIQSEMKNTLDAKAKDFKEQTNNVVGHLNELPTKYIPSAGGVEKEDAIKRMVAQRQSLDNFLEMMDDWKLGYFSKTFGAPLKHSADLQAKLHMEWEDAMNAAMEKWCPTKEARRQADQENYYKELKANANKHTLINMLIQMGNESSMKRLCETRMVACENSDLWVIAGENNNYTADEAVALTRNNLLEFLSQNLTKADVEFAQAKVDAVNKLWPLLSEVNKRTKGFAPRKVEATPVAFKPSDGDYMTFRGGYYPLARDGRMGSMRAGSEALADTENQYTQQHSMSTVQSTSKGRTDAKYPVALNYGYEFNMIEDTIHDIAYREVMMDFNKLLKNQKVYSTLKQKLGIENFNLLRETLWKCARPKSVQDSVMAERAFNSWASWIRGKIVNALIACNLKVSLQNIGNVFLYGNAVEGFTHADVFAALPNVFKGIEWHKAARNKVFELSPFMRERAKAPNFAMKEVAEENAAIKNFKSANGLTNADGAINKIKDSLDTLEEGTQKFGARLLEVTDNITAIPVWLQAYNKQLQLGKSQQEAIDFADTVIRRTLGSNRLQDVSSMMRGGQMYKLFTAFQSFFNTQFNQWYREYKIDTKLFSKGEYKEAFMRVMSFVIAKWIFACIATTVIGTLSPTKPFEKDKKGWPDIYKELITYPIAVAGGPGGQIALEGVQALLGMQSYGYRLSVIENTIGKGISFMHKSNSVAQGKKDANELIEPAAEIIAIALGLPLQAIRTGGNLVNWVMGDMDLELEDLLNRRRKDERKKNR